MWMGEQHTAVPVSTLSTAPRPKQTAPTIACCLCGRLVCSDLTVEGRCVNCLSATTDFTEHIERHNEVELCRTCGSWYRNPQWVRVQPESPELLALCLRRVKGLKGMKLVSLLP
jgi:nonsense-mediated mRNA decay protein 3